MLATWRRQFEIQISPIFVMMALTIVMMRFASVAVQ